MYPEKELAQIIISACEFYQVESIVISPGSRNAPLTIGFSNHSSFKIYSIVDERCAAFFALGIAQQTQKPVALVCTSGSALLNYYPAIAEAFYSQIPLVVISADRPKYLIDKGDGQTIRQENVFENHILFSANLFESNEAKNIELISKAFELLNKEKGPIHLNVPFDEPLYNLVDKVKAYNFPKIVLPQTENVDYLSLATKWNKAAKKMILVGVHYPDEELETLLDEITDDSSVLVLTETTSNLHNPKFVYDIDNLIFNLSEGEFQDLQPDILLTFGGFIVSKKIKKFLRRYQPKEHWHVDETIAFDTYFSLTKHIKTDSCTFFQSFKLNINKNTRSNYQSKWILYREHTLKKHQEFLAKAVYSDLTVFEQVLKAIPNYNQVHFSNSAIIRYSQLFRLNKTLTLFCNRGTSGIDGSTSTAIGSAVASKNQTTLVTGDLSFFYDSNALWNQYIPKSFRIILINNAGGGIFKIIPGPSTTNSLEFFTTPHSLTAEHLCKMFNIEYVKTNDMNEVKIALASFYQNSDKPKLLEIFTPSEENDKVLKEYINYLK